MPSTPAALLEPLRLPEASDPEDFDPEDFSPGSAEEALLRPHPPGSVGHRPPPAVLPALPAVSPPLGRTMRGGGGLWALRCWVLACSSRFCSFPAGEVEVAPES